VNICPKKYTGLLDEQAVSKQAFKLKIRVVARTNSYSELAKRRRNKDTLGWK